MIRKNINVIGIQHSCTRLFMNIFSKHPQLIGNHHISIPSDNYIKTKIIGDDFFDKENDIVLIVSRCQNYTLHSNDNENNNTTWNNMVEANIMKTDNERATEIYSDDFLENGYLAIKDLIIRVLIPNKIKYMFVSAECLFFYKELYVKNVIEQLGLSYDDYPKNMSGVYYIKDNIKMENVNIDEYGGRDSFLDIEIYNANEKYYKKHTCDYFK